MLHTSFTLASLYALVFVPPQAFTVHSAFDWRFDADWKGLSYGGAKSQKTGLIADTAGAEIVLRVARDHMPPGGSIALSFLSSYEGVGRVRVEVAGTEAVVDGLWESRSSQTSIHVISELQLPVGDGTEGGPRDPLDVRITLLPSDGDPRREKRHHFKLHGALVFGPSAE